VLVREDSSLEVMQDLAPLRSGRTPLQAIERAETSLRSRACQVQMSVRKYPIEFSCSSLSSSSSSLYGYGAAGWYGVVCPKWRRGRMRVVCAGSEREPGAGVEEVGDETGGKVGSSYFADAKRGSSAPATRFDPRRPFDLGWIAAWADGVSERGMQRRRTFYSHDDWLEHRSSTRHYRHFRSSFSSRAILSLIPPVGTVTAISVAVALYNTIVLSGWLPSFVPLLHASPLSYQLTAPALALLLVFRTEASYSRYDEARKTWTKVISSSKDIARQSMAWAQRPVDTQQKQLLLDYILAFPVALKVNINCCHSK
jgi:hypothetical protein